MPTLGLDIGGANLKGAWFDGKNAICQSLPFALWRQPQRLADTLAQFLLTFPPTDTLAVTMTGELCDCFADKREGVQQILAAVRQVAVGRRALVWTTDGHFLPLAEAFTALPLTIAASNWLALATWAGRLVREGPALLVDVGSTTSDLIPLLNGTPIPNGRTDPARLRSGELVYTGVRRTPVCALVRRGVAAEFFATTLDVYLILQEILEEPENPDTADGRPATVSCAHSRLARMFCADISSSDEVERLALARLVRTRQQRLLASAARKVRQKEHDVLISAGAGEFLARAALAHDSWQKTISLSTLLGPAVSTAACAYACAVLSAESKT